MSGFVLDASVALCWCFKDQSTQYTDAILERLAGGEVASAPCIWPLEVTNALLVAERRKVLMSAQTGSFLENLSALAIRIDSAGPNRAFGQVLAIARQHRLSSYDAAYLELAIREGLPLATMDAQLRTAARIAGVKPAPAGI